jgi:hypothetical protein
MTPTNEAGHAREKRSGVNCKRSFCREIDPKSQFLLLPPHLTYRASQIAWPRGLLFRPKTVLQWLARVLQWVTARSLEIGKCRIWAGDLAGRILGLGPGSAQSGTKNAEGSCLKVASWRAALPWPLPDPPPPL